MANVSIATGVVDTATVTAGEQKIDMSEKIMMLDPDSSQFTTMMMKLGSEDARSYKVEWLEDQLRPRLSALAASATSAAVTIVVTTGQGDYFRARDLVRVATTGEMVLVTSISTDTLTVTRAIGATAAASAASGGDLLIVSNAATQGATLGTRKITKKTAAYNYTQIQRDPYGFTETERNVATYGGPPDVYESVKKLVEHKRALENTCFFGARSFTSNAPTSFGTCGGAVEFISTNIHNAAGTLSHATLDTYLRSDLQHGSTNKVLFVAPLVAQAISGYLKTAYSPTEVGTKKFGATVNAYISGAYGTELPVVVKRDWQDFSSANTGYGGWAFLIDMDYVKFRPLQNRNTRLLRDRQANDADESTNEYLTEFSLEFRTEAAHSVIKGVTG